jgi:hypothetical protein
VNVAAPPRPPARSENRRDDPVQALIEEARQRARRRRWIYGAIAVAVVVAAVAATVTFAGSDTTSGERSGLDTSGGAAVGVAATRELVASMYVHHTANSGTGDAFVYLYGDGRLVWSGEQMGSATGWREQRLTPDGVELVRADIIASGLFDPDRPPPGSEHGASFQGIGGAQIQVRDGDRLVYVPLTTGREWTPDYLDLIARLLTQESWLPASAWADSEATTYVPARYALCTESMHEPLDPSDILPLLPAAAAALLSTATSSTFDELTREVDPASHERLSGNQSRCFLLSREHAQSVAASLDAELTPATGHLVRPLDERIQLLFMPVLPHGVPECTCYG